MQQSGKPPAHITSFALPHLDRVAGVLVDRRISTAMDLSTNCGCDVDQADFLARLEADAYDIACQLCTPPTLDAASQSKSSATTMLQREREQDGQQQCLESQAR